MPGSASLGLRQELGRQAKASGVAAHTGRSESGPTAGRRAGGQRGALGLGSRAANAWSASGEE